MQLRQSFRLVPKNQLCQPYQNFQMNQNFPSYQMSQSFLTYQSYR
jgi:hypothetical protein